MKTHGPKNEEQKKKSTHKNTVIRIMPPLVIKKRQVDFLIENLVKYLHQPEE